MLRDLECQVEMLPDGSIVKDCIEVAATSVPMFRDVLPVTGGSDLVLAVLALCFTLVGVHAVWVSRRG